MKTERRNLYRVLHVQPEAPTEVITAVYRCLMSKLKMHPDLGGNHEIAAQINDAYAVLSDPAKRKAYDAQRKLRTNARRSEPAADARTVHAAATSTGRHAAHVYQNGERAAADGHCPLCNHTLPRFIALDTHCERCGAPLAPIADHAQGQRELLGRRAANRVARADDASIQIAPHHPFVPARLRDMSLSGVGVVTAEPVETEAVIRIMTDSLDVLAQVVKVRHTNTLYHVHARLLTGHFGKRSGVFVSATA